MRIERREGIKPLRAFESTNEMRENEKGFCEEVYGPELLVAG